MVPLPRLDRMPSDTRLLFRWTVHFLTHLAARPPRSPANQAFVKALTSGVRKLSSRAQGVRLSAGELHVLGTAFGFARAFARHIPGALDRYQKDIEAAQAAPQVNRSRTREAI